MVAGWKTTIFLMILYTAARLSTIYADDTPTVSYIPNAPLSQRENPGTSVFPLLSHIVPEELKVNLPRPYGLSYVYHTQNQWFGLDEVSINDGKFPEELVHSVNINAISQTHSLRADLWLFPFLNLFILAGRTFGNADVYINLPEYPEVLDSKYTFDRWVIGPGATLSFGYGGFFVALTGSFGIIFSDSSDPSSSFVFQGQFGYSFPLFNIWIGTMYQDTDPYQSGILVDGVSYKTVVAYEDKWNYLIGFRISFWKQRMELIVQQGFGERTQTTVNLVTRFGQ